MTTIRLLFALLLATRLAFAHDASEEMAAAANNFLATLNAEQKARVAFPFPDAERENWHFIPRARKGLPFKEMTQEQRLLAQALLATGLSHRGYAKAVSIMSLESVLAELEKGSGPVRDPEMYFVTIFGKPGVEPWGWRLEGHHLSQNFTAVGGEAPSMTPSFFGTNPGEVLNGTRKGTRILGNEEELGRKLIKSLNAEQQKVAIINADAPKDVLNDPKRVDPTKPEGIVADKLDGDQLEILVKLIKEYLFRNRPDVAAEEFARIEKDGAGKVTFAWAGGLERGQPHYYRVQGTTFVLEYDNTQNDANHVHSLWRDFAHDFDRDLLAKHLKEAHSK